MQDIMSHMSFPKRRVQRNERRWHHSMFARVLWLCLLVAAVAGSALLYAQYQAQVPRSAASVHSAKVVPADLFIQSVVKGDGSLGWHQLCPSVQSQLPLAELAQQADALRNDARHYGVTFTSDFIGARPRPAGGSLRVYVVTAHWPNGSTQPRTYSVLTQQSGCVEDIQTQ